MVWVDRHSVELGPYMNAVTPTIWKAVISELQRLGIKRFLSTTYPNGPDGGPHKVWRNVPTPFEQIYGKRDDIGASDNCSGSTR